MMLKNLSTDEEQELRILELIEQQERLTQRGIASELQIAIGLANSLVKRLTLKGYIKIKQIPSRRFAYYITPEGFFEKSRLVSKYISNSVQFLGEVRQDYEKIAAKLKSAGQKKIGCVGTGEILEIAQMVFHAHNITISFVIDITGPKKQGSHEKLSDVPEEMRAQVASLILTESQRPHKAFALLVQEDLNLEIFHPAFMKISQRHNWKHSASVSPDGDIS